MDRLLLTAIPFFFVFIGVELLALRHAAHEAAAERAARGYELRDTATSLAMGVGHLVIGAGWKLVAVAAYAGVVESLDRRKLVSGLDKGAHQRDGSLDVLLQVSLDPPDRDGRSGADPADLADLAAAVDEAGALELRGLMAVAPLGEDPAAAFARLADVRREFLADHPAATWLSAGMSGDLEAAITHGATHVRVGSAVLGPRPTVQ